MSFNRWLGLEPGDPETDGEGTVVLETRPEHQVAPGTIHFAVLATVAEVSAAQAVSAQAGVSVVPASVSLQLLRRARPGRLVGRGRVLKTGRRLATADGEVTQDGELVAKATVTFAILGG